MQKISLVTTLWLGWNLLAAAESREIQRLEDMVITPTRDARPVFKVPQAVERLDAGDIRSRQQARTLPEALRDTNGVLLQKTGNSQASPFIRGFTGFRNLLLIDGIPLNNSVFRDGPNQYWGTVDSYAADSVELARGAGSVLYGSDAVGGTLQVRTHEHRAGSGRPLEMNSSTRLSSAESSWAQRVELGADLGQYLGIWLGGSLRSYGTLEAGDPTGRQPNTGYDEQSGDLKMSLRSSEVSRWVLAHQYSRQDDAWRTHQTTSAVSFSGSTIGSELRRSLDQTRRLTYLQYHNEAAGFFDALRWSISLHEQDEEQDRLRLSGGRQRLDQQAFEVDTLGTFLQLEKETSGGRWSGGFDLYHDEVDSSKREWDIASGVERGPFIQGPVADDARYDSFGIYLQDIVTLSKSFELILGTRWSASKLHAGRMEDPASGGAISMEDSTRALVGSAKLSFTPSERWNVYGGVGQSFRAPNLSDLTRLDTARTNEIETPVPGGLDPERFLSYDLGVKFRSGFADLSLAWYYTDIDDLIVRAPTGRIIGTNAEVTKKNSGQGHVQGIEFGASMDLTSAWHSHLKFDWMDGELESFPTSAPTMVVEPMSRMLPVTTRVGLRYEPPASRTWCGLETTIAGQQDKLSASDRSDTQRIPPGGTPSYTLWTLRGGWKISRHLTLNGAVENIFDEDYRIHGSGQNEAGVNGVLGVELKI